MQAGSLKIKLQSQHHVDKIALKWKKAAKPRESALCVKQGDNVIV